MRSETETEQEFVCVCVCVFLLSRCTHRLFRPSGRAMALESGHRHHRLPAFRFLFLFLFLDLPLILFLRGAGSDWTDLFSAEGEQERQAFLLAAFFFFQGRARAPPSSPGTSQIHLRVI